MGFLSNNKKMAGKRRRGVKLGHRWTFDPPGTGGRRKEKPECVCTAAAIYTHTHTGREEEKKTLNGRRGGNGKRPGATKLKGEQ
jgi:hypothetical protein